MSGQPAPGPDGGARLEQDLRRRYRQPRGVEQYGIEAVPEDQKTIRWPDLFVIILNFLVNPGMILIAALAVAAGLPFWGAVLAEVLGVGVAFIAYVAMATMGVDYGIPGQVGTRIAYGLRGAPWVPSLLHVVSSIYWFAFQTVAGALGITAVLERITGADISLVLVSVVFALVQAAIAIFGYGSLKALSRVAFPLKLLLIAYIVILLVTHDDPAFAPSQVLGFAGTIGWQWGLLAVWINSVMAAWLSMITDAADFCRYSRSRWDMWVGTLAAAVLGTLLSAFVGGYAAAATGGTNSNAFDVIATVMDGALPLILLLCFLVLDNWTINVLNLYTGGLSLANIVARMGRFWATLLVSAAGVALSVTPSVVDQFNGLMTVMGNVFAPIAGVLLADYLLVKRMQITVSELFDPAGRYRYWAGFNLVALAWTAIGCAVYWATPAAWVQNVVTIVVTFVGYALTVRVAAARTSRIPVAEAAPSRVPVGEESHD